MKPIIAAVALPIPLRKKRSSKMEDGRGIEIRDRRPALQIHPRDETGGMDDESRDEQDEGITAEGLRPNEPGSAGENEDQNVENHRAVKWLQLVEDRLDVRLANSRREMLFHPSGIVVERRVESRRVIRGESARHCRVSGDRGMQIARGQKAENAFSHFAPLQRIVVRRDGRDRQKITGLGEKAQALQPFGGDAAVHRDR